MTLPLTQTLPLQGSQLIEASAGTGKTFTIALLYVRLVLGPVPRQEGGPDPVAQIPRPLLPPEILVTTFTVAAAEELKERIRKRLVEASSAFLEQGDPDALLGSLCAEYPKDHWPEYARILELAAQWMDQAAISTIHSWAQKVLRSHAFDSGNLFDHTLVTDVQTLQRTAVEDYWRKHCYPLERNEAELLRQLFQSPAKLLEAMKPALHRPQAPITFLGKVVDALAPKTAIAIQFETETTTQQHLEKARACFRKHKTDLLTVMHALRPRLNGHHYRGKLKPIERFETWLTTIDLWASGDDAAGADALNNLGFRRQTTKKGEPHADHEFFHLLDHWLDAREQQVLGLQRVRAEIIAHARNWVLDHINRALNTNAELGFDDLLKRLDSALRGERGDHLAAALRHQYPVAMIDEFQDTDPVQYGIFNAIYDVGQTHDDRALILIGDPKQAIYRFRGADIYTYLAAKRSAGKNLHHLGKNFRATRAMVEAVNHLFNQAEAHADGAFKVPKQAGDKDRPLPFLPADANGLEEALQLCGETPTALTAWWWNEAVRVKPYRRTMAAHAAEQISLWLSSAESGFTKNQTFTRLQPKDIAILVRDHNDARAIRGALRERGLASVYLSDRDSVFGSSEARDFLYWLRACAEPEDDAGVRLALGSRSLGLDLGALDELRENELTWEAHQERFIQLRDLWQRDGVLPMVRQLMHSYAVAEHLQRLPHSDRAITNLLHLAEWAQQASSTLDGEQALIRELEAQIADPAGEEHIIRLESEANLIQVVTVHKSKGLEYPIVIAPFAASWRDTSRDKEALHRNDETLHVEVGKRRNKEEREQDAKRDQGNPNGRDPHTEAAAEAMREDLRLLYVTVTRACHACFLGVAPIAPGGKTIKNEHSALGYLLAGVAEYKTPGDLLKRLDGLAKDCPSIQVSWIDDPLPCTKVKLEEQALTLTSARTAGDLHFESWWIASYSSLETQASATDSAPETAAEANRTEEAMLEGDDSESESFPDAANIAEASNAPSRTGKPTPDTLHSFPRGPEPGTFLHGLLEWAGEVGFAQALEDPDALRTVVARRCMLRGWGAHADVATDWLEALLNTPLPCARDACFKLGELHRYKVEQPFHFAARRTNAQQLGELVAQSIQPELPRPALAEFQLNGLIKGFIDLVAEYDGRYYVIDWKSNYLGPDDATYTDATLSAALIDKRYDVQFSLYLLALHRHLKRRLPDYDYERHIGGGLFVFLRGLGADSRGVWYHKPDRDFIDQLDALFGDPELHLAEAG